MLPAKVTLPPCCGAAPEAVPAIATSRSSVATAVKLSSWPSRPPNVAIHNGAAVRSSTATTKPSRPPPPGSAIDKSPQSNTVPVSTDASPTIKCTSLFAVAAVNKSFAPDGRPPKRMTTGADTSWRAVGYRTAMASVDKAPAGSVEVCEPEISSTSTAMLPVKLPTHMIRRVPTLVPLATPDPSIGREAGRNCRMCR